MIIDLNCDLGEGQANDLAILPMVTSINVACCAHAGDPEKALLLLKEAARIGVKIGAHPGYFDREHFGRLELHQDIPQIQAELFFQLGGFMELAHQAGAPISHLKPHGAMYHRAMNDTPLADLLVRAAIRFNLALMGMKDSELEKAARGKVQFQREGFADRKYLPDGNLVPRSSPDAMIHDPLQAARQILRLSQMDSVQTICVHGDTDGVLEFLRELKVELKKLGIRIGNDS